MNTRLLSIVFGIVALCMTGLAQAANFSGVYQGTPLSMQIQSAGDGYSGVFIANNQQYPFTATATDTQLSGQFQNQGNPYAFTATLDAQGTTLTVQVNGVNYQMTRQGGPAALPAPITPPAPAAAAGFVGTFQNAQFAMQIQLADGNNYTGLFSNGSQQIPFKATATDNQMMGQVSNGTTQYIFTATLDAQGQNLTLTINNQPYQLARQSAAQQPPPTGALGPAPQAADYVGHFSSAEMDMQIQATANGFSGTIAPNNRQGVPFTATLQGGVMVGQLTADQTYSFTATLDGQKQTLTFTVNQKSYVMTRQDAGAVQPTGSGPAAAGVDFSGSYIGQQISMQIQSTGDGKYSGAIVANGQQFPFTGQASGNRMDGQFPGGNNAAYVSFNATLDGQTLSLLVNGQTYKMTKQGGNPAAPAPVPNPIPAPVPAPAQGGATNFAGSFKNGPIDVEIQAAANGSFTGTVAAHGGTFQLQATVQNAQLVGQLNGQGGPYNFTASLDASGQTLTITVEGDAQQLTRQGAAAQQPAAPAPQQGGSNPFLNLLPQNNSPPQNSSPPPNNGNGGNVMVTPKPGNGPASAPRGYDVIATVNTGQTLMTLQAGARSARQATSTAMAALSTMFDARPQALAACADANDQKCVETFNATLHGQPIRGVVITGMGPNGAATSVMFDHPDAPNAEWAALAAALPVPIQWQDQQLPDGSGSMKLPTGWKIGDAANGAVDVIGPQGQAISLGIADIMETPQAAQAFAQSQINAGMRPTPPSLPVAQFGDPVTALKNACEAMNSYRKTHGDPDTVIHIKDILSSTPTQFPQGQAAFIHFTSTIHGKGIADPNYESIALVNCAAIADGQWMYYYSVVSAPQAIFQRELPTMLQAWQTWKVSDAVLKARIDHAMQDMRDIAKIIQDEEAYRRKVYEKCNEAWDQCIIGYSTVGDPETGMGYEWVPAQNAQQLIDKLNAGGGNNYQIVQG